MSSKMKAAQISKADGICHTDALVKEGLWPGLQYPRVPGQVLLSFVAFFPQT